jgi:2'-5' RNA ligase
MSDDVYDRAWKTFRGLRRLAPHRADWGEWAGSRAFHLLALAPVQGVDMRQVQDALRHLPGVELHPPEFLHITIQSLGFPDRPDSIGCVLGALEEQITQLPAFDLELGGLNALHSCTFLEVRPTAALMALRTAVRRGVGDAITALDPYPDYLFHLTVGYFDAGASVEKLVAAIEPLRTHAAGTLHVAAVDVVALPTDQRVAFPPLDPIARFNLTG